MPVTLGVIGLYAGLAAGLTAAFSGRFARRVWWPVHKVAVVSFVLVWLHGVLAGIDTSALLGMYVITGLAVLILGVSRYTTPTARERVDELAAVGTAELRAWPWTAAAERVGTAMMSEAPPRPRSPTRRRDDPRRPRGGAA